MANYTLANLVKAQAKLNGAFQNAELRFRQPETFKTYMNGSASFFPDYEMLKTREDRTLEANYFLRTARALTNARAHNHTGNHGDSGVLTPSFTSYVDKFALTLKQADNSIFAAAEEYNDKIQNVVANFAEGLETVAVNHAFANRSGVNGALVEGTFDAANDVFEITDSTHGNRAIQITNIVMDVNKYSKVPLVVVCDSVAFNKFQFLANQGIQNSTNTSFQFQGVRFVHAPELSALAVALDATYVKGFWLAVPEGMVGGLSWIPKQNRQGLVTSVNMYGSLINPIDGLQYGVHMYETRADGTAVNGQKQDVTTEVEISIDIALEKAPLSVAGASPIFAFSLV
jgi:hypothetical protein